MHRYPFGALLRLPLNRSSSSRGREEEIGVRIHISDPLVAQELADALAAAECTAEWTARNTLHVDISWADGDTEQARLELRFFVRAWQARRPGVRAFVVL